MKKLLIRLSVLSIAVTPILSVVSCGDVKKPSFEDFYYLELNEITNENSTEKLIEVFERHAAVKIKENTEEAFKIANSLFLLWQFYGLIINDHFSESINWAILEEKYASDQEFIIFDLYLKRNNFLEEYDYFQTIDTLTQEAQLVLEQIKKDYDKVFLKK